MKKVLLFGPFGDFGGRELEASFIASVLSSRYEVDICTSGLVTKDSQLFGFNKKQQVFSIKDLICQRYFSIKILALLSYFKNHLRGILNSYANNIFAKRYLNYDEKVNTILDKLVSNYDLVLICAQFSSNYTETIVASAKKHGIKIVFRTTGQIRDIEFSYIKDIDLFIHHSIANARNLKLENYDIIDQCSFIEDKLLSLTSNNGNTNFLLLGRLSAEKGFAEAIDFLMKCRRQTDTIVVAGEGDLKEELQLKYATYPEVNFVGFVESENLDRIFQKTDCLVISSFEESGPLIGIEAMAAARTIISTKVGAMEERLEGTLNDFWFDIKDYNSFEKVFNQYKSLDIESLNEINQSLRIKYKQTYAIESISIKYIKSIDKVMGL